MSFTVLGFIDYNIQRENYLVARVLYLSGLLKHDSKAYYCFDLLDTNLNVLMSQGKIIKQQDYYDFKQCWKYLEESENRNQKSLVKICHFNPAFMFLFCFSHNLLQRECHVSEESLFTEGAGI